MPNVEVAPGMALLIELIDAGAMGFLPAHLRIAAWAALCGLLSMWIYKSLSPQKRIASAREAAVRDRAALSAYDGPADGLAPLARRAISAAALQLGLTLGPALASAVPVIGVFIWMHTVYNNRAPTAGETIAMRVVPAEAVVSVQPEGVATRTGEGLWTIRWPDSGAALRVTDAEGAVLASLPLPHNAAVVGQKRWWHAVTGSPGGYLAPAAAVQSIAFDMPFRQYIPFGPAWLRGWYTPFFLVTLAVSMALKRAWRLA